MGGPLVHTLYAPSPRYTKEARRARIKGTVVLEEHSDWMDACETSRLSGLLVTVWTNRLSKQFSAGDLSPS